jgi:hypothetical protein
LAYLSTRESQEKLVTASVGFDLPVFEGLNDFKIYEEEGPPRGTNYNMVPRGDVIASVVGYPAPLKIGTQMFAQATVPKMIAMCTQSGKSIEAAMSWAETEIEGLCGRKRSRSAGCGAEAEDGAKVVGGPAPRRLPALPLKIDDGRLVVAKPFIGRPGFQQM